MRSILLYILTLFAGAFRAIENFARDMQEQVRQREHQIVYNEFEVAINAWEKRTGRTVERVFRDDVGSGEGRDWKHFAAFLGSREADKWRRYGLSFDEMINEWEQLHVPEPEMVIEGEEK